MIEQIRTELIDNHPNNPRQDYNNLEELTESIKVMGILQNLTLVKQPEDNGRYWAVIGNRRLLAAKAAGLETVPAEVTEMDEQTQASTMLLENMQRSDLTPYEEAEGFQMCLDLGMTEDDLSEKTGLSKTTIKHRTKLLELDKANLKEKIDNGATLFDFMKLEKIKDPEVRNDIMKNYMGTSNFDYQIQAELRHQKVEDHWQQAKEIIEKFAEYIDRQDYNCLKHQYIKEYGLNEKIEIPEDAEKKKYLFAKSYNGLPILYKLKDTENEEIENDDESDGEPSQWEIERREREEKRERLNEIKEVTFNSRYKFFTGKEKKEIADKALFKYAAFVIGTDNLYYSDEEDEYKSRNFEECETTFKKMHKWDKELTVSDAEQIIKRNPRKELEKLIYASLEPGLDIPTMDYNDKFEKNEEFEMLYEFLEMLGYRTSDIEKSLLDGTHEEFVKEEETEDE